jgi:hypothetical protein
MIFPFFRNNTVAIVVLNNKFRQCVAVEKSKNLLERCQRITPSIDQGVESGAGGGIELGSMLSQMGFAVLTSDKY